MNTDSSTKRTGLDSGPVRGGLRTVFAFPGQGAYDYTVLRDLYTNFRGLTPAFLHADATTSRRLGRPFLPLVTARSQEEHDDYLSRSPELDQIGIYLAGVVIARLLSERGVHANLVFGHSFGDFAALVSAGVYSFETGLDLVCDRVEVLAEQAVQGGMAAVSSDAGRLRQLLAGLPYRSLEVSVLNHARQTCVSGDAVELEALGRAIAEQGVSVTILKSPYPFHSRHLAAAVDPFRARLGDYPVGKALVPLYLCSESRIYGPDCDLPKMLSDQLGKPLDFIAAAEALYSDGYRTFVECGAGDIVSRLLHRNLPGDVLTIAIGIPGEGVQARLTRAGEVASKRGDATAAVVVGESDRDSEQRLATQGPAPRSRVDLPIAIVSMACVLPGAEDADHFWRNICAGVSGIIDLTGVHPHAESDYVAGTPTQIVPDKTYTLLNGSILDTPYHEVLTHAFERSAFESLTAGQRLLALTLSQSLAGLETDLTQSRIQCILGATADGSRELDDALFLDSLLAVLEQLDEPAELRRSFARLLEERLGYTRGASGRLGQLTLYSDVVTRTLGRAVPTYILDTACSSSLYAIALGMKALRAGISDVVLAGGVFAPGPANNTLFAQFRGLTPVQSRPMDRAADGVVFGDGAGLVILKRLPEALASGDRVLGVIRGMGLSSDGTAPSINVPQSSGQTIAIRKAYDRSEIDPNTIQYIEAHATATPVGDAVEFFSLNAVFGSRDPALPPIQLGSAKALIGHTGWASGVASVIKMCKAFEAETVPRQYNYDAPNPQFNLDETPFVVSVEEAVWPENIDGIPRRAGINAFGFGGTNAHLVLEAFDEAYHSELCSGAPNPVAEREALAVIGVGSLFPASDEFEQEAPSRCRRFDRCKLRLPAGKLLLPDVCDHMDLSQYLAALAAEKIFLTLPKGWEELKTDTGVVLGLSGKTERGVRLNERIFLDSLHRALSGGGSSELSGEEVEALYQRLAERVREDVLPSGPYALPGLMPNVAAARITHMFDLRGPNVVVDDGDRSLSRALHVAEQLLRDGDAKIILAGALNGFARTDDFPAEGIFCLALASLETAREHELPVLALLESADPGDSSSAQGDGARTDAGIDYGAATGADALWDALQRVRNGAGRVTVDGNAFASGWTLNPSDQMTQSGPSPKRESGQREPVPPAGATYDYVRDTPIYGCVPILVPQSAQQPAKSLSGRHVLFLTDEPDWWTALESSGALAHLSYSVVCPSDSPIKGAISVDLGSEAGLTESLKALEEVQFEVIVTVKNLATYEVDTLLEDDLVQERRLLELTFGVSRHAYQRILGGEVDLGGLCLGAFRGERLDPYTGLMAGFYKSLAREAQAGNCKLIHTDGLDFSKALEQLELEFGQPRGVHEVCYRDGIRHRIGLRAAEPATSDRVPYLGADSVVLATGGGRGVTAVLVEELLESFGCTVVAVGRTDLATVPGDFLAMSESELEAFEGQFYREQLASDNPLSIKDLKRLFQSYRSANELHHNVRRLEGLPGRFVYRCADITDRKQVDDLMTDVYRKHGHVDLVLHGAGMQHSQALPKKSLELFRRIVTTKLDSLQSFYQACNRLSNGRPVRYHLLTSAFSFMGNDGQPDYGAVNEAANRLADAMNGRDAGRWSSLAWLGWAGIGMTRGSEFAALAANRRLRGITRAEGRAIFAHYMNGTPQAAVNILMADGEIAFYEVEIERDELCGIPLTPPPRVNARERSPASPLDLSVPKRRLATTPEPLSPRKTHNVSRWDLSLDNAPFLHDHVISGIPTLPGAFKIAMMAEAAQQLRPKLGIMAFENAQFHHFVRVYAGGTQVRVHADIVEEHKTTLIRVRLLSDFVHKSGRTLRADIVQAEILVRMGEESAPYPFEGFSGVGPQGRNIPDPYVSGDSNVSLAGPFDAMRNILVGESTRRAEYSFSDAIPPGSPFAYLLRNVILVDALWRFGAIEGSPESAMSVYVPIACEKMHVFFDYGDFNEPRLSGRIHFEGSNPERVGDNLRIGPVEAVDSTGTLVRVEGGICRPFGSVVPTGTAAPHEVLARSASSEA